MSQNGAIKVVAMLACVGLVTSACGSAIPNSAPAMGSAITQVKVSDVMLETDVSPDLRANRKCKSPARMGLKTYNNPAAAKVASVKAAMKKISPKAFGVKVPVYVVLWGINGERGVNKKTASKIANMAIDKMYPKGTGDKEFTREVREDIVNKTQRETLTADYYEGACAGFIFSAATNVSDFPNYLGKTTFHEFFHIYQNSFYNNNPKGDRTNPAWLNEGFAEFWALRQAIKQGWTDQEYLDGQLSEIKSKVRTQPKYANLKIFEDEFGDKWPVHSIEIGLVAANFLLQEHNGGKSTKAFTDKLYAAMNKYGWAEGFKKVTKKLPSGFYKEFSAHLLTKALP